MGILAFLRYLFEILGLIGREVHDAEERKAGSDANQVEAINAEINHVNRAADLGVCLGWDGRKETGDEFAVGSRRVFPADRIPSALSHRSKAS